MVRNVPVAITLVLGMFFGWYYAHLPPQGRPSTQAKTQTHLLQNNVLATGTVNALKTVQVGSQVSGIVKAVYAEALPAAREGTLFIDTSTISVDDAREIHAQATERGLVQLDAPVSGGVKGATAGTLAFMVGGEAEAVERARPVLEPLAGKIIHCGSSGTGQAAKLCNNMVLAVQQIAAGEAFVLAEKLGLSAQSLFDVITGATGNCWAIHTNCPVPGPVPTSPANNDFKPGFATALMNKDIGLAMDAVKSTGSSAPLGSHAAEIYAKFAADHADKDFSAVIEMIRKG